MRGYWITFTDGDSGYCEGGEMMHAVAIAQDQTGKTVRRAVVIPYPACPIIWQFDHPTHGKTPAFCVHPKTCAGHTSCPRTPACTS